jgi:hypothetical protein
MQPNKNFQPQWVPSASINDSTPFDLINLQTGWPTPRLSTTKGLLAGAREVLSSEAESAVALIYDPHTGHPHFTGEFRAAWMSSIYSRPISYHCIYVQNGASPDLSNVVQKFTDPM